MCVWRQIVACSSVFEWCELFHEGSESFEDGSVNRAILGEAHCQTGDVEHTRSYSDGNKCVAGQETR